MLSSLSSLFSFVKKSPSFALTPGFTVTAHTGCEGTADNSLESIRRGAAAGADIIEIDLHFLPDGTPVLKHDAPKEGEAHSLPTLEGAFELLSTLAVKMNVDVKATANMPAVAALAQKHGVADRIFFTGVDEKFAPAVKAGAPAIPYYLNVKVDKKKNTDPAYLASLIEKVRDCGAVGINTKFTGCSRDLVAAFRAAGLPVSVWTAKTKAQMYRCLLLEPDNITTRKPSLLCGIIKR
ncbi:MAG: glycerophosphodiester phosphodiesterase [Ruminococcaceae bacterium]|nr:glycerophosphodiester phosphodiesterase [Oscillospiraceae bacterium]